MAPRTADTIAGQIYFYTPSAQVRVPVGYFVFPPPTSAHTILLGGKLSRGGVKTIRRRNNYPGRARVGQKFEKNRKIVSQCRKYPIPNLYTLNRITPYLYTLNRTIPSLYTLTRTTPYLNTLSRFLPYVNALSRTIPYLNTLSRTHPILIHQEKPNLAQNQILVGSQSESSMKKTLKSRQPIRIEYHSAESYPILIHCRNIPSLKSWVGDPPRPLARVGCYSLSKYIDGPQPLLTSAHTLPTGTVALEQLFQMLEDQFLTKIALLAFIVHANKKT